MTRRVFKSGNSLAVTLPPEARELGIDAGQEVDVKIRDGAIVVRPAHGVSRELLEWTDAFVERNRELLERLA